MPKKTIAQEREENILKLAERRSKNPTESDIDEARRILNSCYRLNGLENRLLILTNDFATANLRWVQKEEERSLKWIGRLNKWLEPYKCKIQASGGYVRIVEEVNEFGGINDLYLMVYYPKCL